jgi:hypothetical protein
VLSVVRGSEPCRKRITTKDTKYTKRHEKTEGESESSASSAVNSSDKIELPAGHHEADLFGRRRLRIDFADDLPFSKYEKAVSQRSDLFKLG